MSDPDGLRAGVERLIAEFDRDIQHGHDPYYIGVQAGRRAAADAARSLLAKHPPTPLDYEETIEHEREFVESAEVNWFIQGGQAQFGALSVRDKNTDGLISEILHRVRLQHPTIPASPPSAPSPVEQEN